ncbi:hypothetical protein WN73_09065 [Bradyrhizobium sp. CCBAU 45394]|uniref:hypothetical protein n=1 Tax=Bradyrhizobium sp. CCBAU 21362 TaxID=1325082 RepID=UPI002304FB8F|nr:hypothetical protein [Bradyrhizobium sp. CCBAU 21362]MDA9390837.1 hypothetical protein [Bradyrhizobium sp. CCBAU 45394]MDA9535714.1 hypothetical protein [Bradyrhizobium sp. CCBAU 21362]
MIRTKDTQPFLYVFVVREVSLDVTDQGLVVPKINRFAMSAKIISKSAKRLRIALNRLQLWVFLSRILGNRLVDNVPMFCREMGMVVAAAAAATGDRTRIGRVRLGQVLLKALLPGMAPLVLFQDGVLHLGPSCWIGWIGIVRVHASLTSKKSIELILLWIGFPEADEIVAREAMHRDICRTKRPRGSRSSRSFMGCQDPPSSRPMKSCGGMGADVSSLLGLLGPA